MHTKHGQQGQSLYEVVFALAITALIIGGVVSLAVVAVSNANFAKNQSLASRYLTEASEWLRQERDADWTVFGSRSSVSPGTDWCLNSLNWSTSGNCSSDMSGTIFRRDLNLETQATGEIRADIVVIWTDAKGLHTVETVAQFTSWQTP